MMNVYLGGCGRKDARSSRTRRPSSQRATSPAARAKATRELQTCWALSALRSSLWATAYTQSMTEDFRECYDPTWSRFKRLTMPVPGKHEYYA